MYKSYQGNEKLTTLSSEISWSHNVALLSKCKDLLEKEFYMKMSRRNGWTYRVLIHPEYIGKMQFYLSVLDDKVRLEGENPAIGIILCKSKTRTVVEYAAP